MKTTNEIEKQLIKKSQEEIRIQASDIVKQLQRFGKVHTQRDYNGMEWNNATDDHNFDFLDWDELDALIVRNMERKWLDDMVKVKSKELLSKLDLLG